MTKTILQKIGGILFAAFACWVISEAFSPAIIEGVNSVSKYAGFLNPNLILNLIGFSTGDLAMAILKAAIIFLSVFLSFRVVED